MKNWLWIALGLSLVVLLVGSLGALGIGDCCSVPAGAEAGDLSMRPGIYIGTDGNEHPADMGYITVSENRDNSATRLIALPVIRIHATGNHTNEPIFWLSGGPGSTNLRVGDLERFLETHDVVLFGYRGVDGSVLLDCPEVSQVLKKTGGNLLAEGSLTRFGQALARCAVSLQSEGVDIEGYTVLDVVEDLDEVRRALGYDRINLLSVSYGTRLAQYYAYMHPDTLFRSAMVAVNPPGHFMWEPDVLDALIEADAELCAADPKCSARTADLAETVRAVTLDMPERWLFLPIDPGKVSFVTQFMLFHRGSAVAAYDAYIDAEAGDPSGLAMLSVMFDQMMPFSVVWGEWAAKGFIDYAAPRDWIREMNPPGSIMGSPVSLLAGGGVLGGSWPVTVLPDWVHEPQVSEHETLLVGGNADFSTPAQFATDELLPLLPNGQQVILSEMGHSGDLFGLQPEAMIHLLTTFFDTGEVDDSHFEYQPMSFDLGMSFSDMAHAVVNAAVAVGILIAAALVVLF